MGNPVKRIQKWDAKYDSTRLKTDIDKMRPDMLAEVTAVFPLIHDMEQQVKQTLDALGISIIQYPFYLNFGRELWHLKRINLSGESLAIEAATLIAKWVARGLVQSVLEAVRTQVFDIGAPAGPQGLCLPVAGTGGCGGPALPQPRSKQPVLSGAGAFEVEPVTGASGPRRIRRQLQAVIRRTREPAWPALEQLGWGASVRVRLLRVVTTAGLVGTLAGIGIAGWAVVRSQAGCVGALLTAGGFVSSLYGFSCAYRSLARKRPTRVVGRGLALTMTSLDLAGRFCSAH